MRQSASPVRRAVAHRVRALLLLFVAVAGALLAGAVPVSAHAALTGSDPQQGAVVDKAPDRVSLTFSEAVALSDGSVRVYDPKGKQVDTGTTSDLGGNTYAVGLHAGLPDGTFTVTYQVVSADSHPVSGAFTFSVGAPSETTAEVPGQEAGGGLVGGLYGFARYAAYAGFILLVGGAAFVLACWPRGAGVRAVQRLVVSGWLTLTAATLALLLLRGSYTGSGKIGDVFDLSLLGDVLQTKTGAALVSRMLLLAAAALFIAVLFGVYVRRDEGAAEAGEGAAEVVEGSRNSRGDSRGDSRGENSAGNAGGDAIEDRATDAGSAVDTAPAVGTDPVVGTDPSVDTDSAAEKRDLTFGLAIGGSVVAVGLAASWAMAEHASTGIQPGIAMPTDVLHLLAVAAWLGGLAALLVALFRAPADAPIEARAVRRFSRVAFTGVLVLAVTGLYQSWRQVGSWSALTGTSYGRLLLLKVGLVAVLLGVAWFSRRWTARLAETPASSAGHGGDEREPVGTGKQYAGMGKQSAGTATDAGDPQRAAQLARQQAAMAAAREKRVRNADPDRTGLRRSVLAEAGVAVVLLAVTTLLTATEPGRTEEEAKAATSSAQQSVAAGQTGVLSLDIPFDTGGEDGKGVVRIDLDPARVGGNDLHIYVQRPDGEPFDIPEVKIAFTLEAKDIGPLPVVPDHITTGHWSASGVQIPMAGDWKVAVTVRTSDIDQVTVNKNAKIG